MNKSEEWTYGVVSLDRYRNNRDKFPTREEAVFFSFEYIDCVRKYRQKNNITALLPVEGSSNMTRIQTLALRSVIFDKGELFNFVRPGPTHMPSEDFEYTKQAVNYQVYDVFNNISARLPSNTLSRAYVAVGRMLFQHTKDLLGK